MEVGREGKMEGEEGRINGRKREREVSRGQKARNEASQLVRNERGRPL